MMRQWIEFMMPETLWQPYDTRLLDFWGVEKLNSINQIFNTINYFHYTFIFSVLLIGDP